MDNKCLLHVTRKVQLLAAKVASQDENRYGLNGLHIEERRIVATNGHILACLARSEAETGTTIGSRKLVQIGTSPAVKADETVPCEIDLDCGDVQVFIGSKGTALKVQVIDGEFPPYRDVLKGVEFQHEIALDGRYLADLSSVLGRQNGSSSNVCRYLHSGFLQPTVVVAMGELYNESLDTFGVIMPVRDEVQNLEQSSEEASKDEGEIAAGLRKRIDMLEARKRQLSGVVEHAERKMHEAEQRAIDALNLLDKLRDYLTERGDSEGFLALACKLLGVDVQRAEPTIPDEPAEPDEPAPPDDESCRICDGSGDLDGSDCPACQGWGIAIHTDAPTNGVRA